MSTLVVRADASSEIGMGHLARCTALAQAWRDSGGRVVFVTAAGASPMLERLRAEQVELASPEGRPGSRKDAAGLADLARIECADWVVLDGYRFDALYQGTVKESGCRLLVVDDDARAEHYRHANGVLNQNIHAHASMYRGKANDARLMLGTDYVLLRREFLAWRGWRRDIPDVAEKVLVTLGGSDPDDVTSKVLTSLKEPSLPRAEVRLVVGPGNPRLRDIESAAQSGHQDVKVLAGVSDMAELMAWADVAVSGAGSTSWELAFMGLPSLLLVLADNQEGVAAGLEEAGAGVNLGWHSDVSAETVSARLAALMSGAAERERMSAAGRALVDGGSMERLLQVLWTPTTRNDDGATGLTLRPVERADWPLLMAWRNDPATIENSIQQHPVSLAEHKSWLDRMLADPGSIIYIGEAGGHPVGQVRFDVDGETAEVSIVVAPEARGRGLGTSLLRQGCAAAGDYDFVAHVRPENGASLAAFTKAGFSRAGTDELDGVALDRMILPASSRERRASSG